MAFDFTKITAIWESITATTNAGDWSGNTDFREKILLLRSLCENRIKNPYTSLLQDAEYNNLLSQLTNFSRSIHAYLSNKNQNTISIVQTQFNQTLGIICKIPPAGKGETQAALSKVLEDFSKRSDAAINNSITKAREFEIHITKLQDSIEKSSAEVQNNIKILGTWQNDFLTAQENRNKEFHKTLQEREEINIKTDAAFSDQFKRNEVDRQDAFDKQSTHFSTRSNTILEEMEGIKKRISNIYDIVGEISQIGLQKHYANEENKTANYLFYGALAAMFTAIAIVAYPILKATTLDWTAVLYRLPITATLLLPAFYMANESKKHRDKENKYRDLEIKLQNIRPYFNEIKSDDKEKVQLDLGKLLLSPSDHAHDENVVIPKDIIEILKSVGEVTIKKPN